MWLVLAAAIAVLIGLWVVVAVASVSGGSAGAQAATLVVAVVSTAAVVLQLVLPSGTSLAPAATCSDTATSGSQLLVRTSEVGENARTGPSTTYPAASRFDSSCLLGIDGYCIGEPVTDRSVDLPDDRWLRLRYSNTFVAAATVTEIQSDAGYRATPLAAGSAHQHRDCTVGPPFTPQRLIGDLSRWRRRRPGCHWWATHCTSRPRLGTRGSSP